MKKITKENFSDYVKSALSHASIDDKLFKDLPLKILQSGSIDLSEPIQPPNDTIELIVSGRKSQQAIRTSGNQVNVFALSSVLLTAASAAPTPFSAVALLLALLGACTVSLTPEQAAFFVAAEALEKAEATPTANAFALNIGEQLKMQNYSSEAVLVLVQGLKNLGVPLTNYGAPENVIRHSEWTVSIPGF